MKPLTIVVLASLAFIILGFYIYSRNLAQPKNSPSPNVTFQPTFSPPSTLSPTPKPTPNISPINKPKVTSPKPNEKVQSPLTIQGTVPPGWMFEGSFPIQLVDQGRNFIAETNAQELIPGSWSSGEQVEFTAILNFKTQVKSGFLILEKDNPSGLEENADSIEIPINF